MKPLLVRLGAAIVLMSVLPVTWSCANDGDGDEGSPVETLTIVAEDTKFSPETITIKSGEKVTFELQNNDSVEHDFQVDKLDVDVIAGGMDEVEHDGDGHGGGKLAMHTGGHESMSITFTANEPGRYEFYCTIPGHRDSGMVGTLTVQ